MTEQFTPIDTEYRCIINRSPHFIYQQQEDGSFIQREPTEEEQRMIMTNFFIGATDIYELPVVDKPDPFLDHYL